MPRHGRHRKKSRTHVKENHETLLQQTSALVSTKEELKVPKSLVIRRGNTAPEIHDLVQDVRAMMQPYTAIHFQEDPKNRKLTLAKYVTHLALPMGITHVMAFSQTEDHVHLRIARTPEGPTLTFRVHQFSLCKHIRALQKRPISWTNSLSSNPPVVVTNNFGEQQNVSPHMKLMRITFQNMFPVINVSNIQLTQCRRILLFHLIEQEVEVDKTTTNTTSKDDEKHKDRLKEKKKIQFIPVRHYAIKAHPVGVNRRIRRIVQDKIPNLGKCNDVSDYLVSSLSGGGRGGGGSSSTGSIPSGHMSDGAAASDSEPEDDPTHIVQLPDRYIGKGNHQNQKSALKLIEIGPRITMELIKVEKGIGNGDILYHAHIQKSIQEIQEIRTKKVQIENLKHQRRTQQEANVARKRQLVEEQRMNKKQKQMEKEKQLLHSLRGNGDDDHANDDANDDHDNDHEQSNYSDHDAEADDA